MINYNFNFFKRCAEDLVVVNEIIKGLDKFIIKLI